MKRAALIGDYITARDAQGLALQLRPLAAHPRLGWPAPRSGAVDAAIGA
jgi:hypothetical protein